MNRDNKKMKRKHLNRKRHVRVCVCGEVLSLPSPLHDVLQNSLLVLFIGKIRNFSVKIPSG